MITVMLLNTRHLLVKQRTQAVNSLRGHLGEIGIIAAKGTAPNLGNDRVFQHGYSLGERFDLVGQHFERHSRAWQSTVLIPTKRIVGRDTASQIASASMAAASFLASS
jgi:transposase